MSADLLFLYGPSGAGKTRLLQMIEESCSESSIMRVGCEQIIADIPPAIGQCLQEHEAVHLRLGPRRPAPTLPSLEELTRHYTEGSV